VVEVAFKIKILSLLNTLLTFTVYFCCYKSFQQPLKTALICYIHPFTSSLNYSENTSSNRIMLYLLNAYCYTSSINHINLVLKDGRSFSIRYKLGIMVIVTLIFQAFEYVAFKATFDCRTFSWKLCSFPCSPWWLTLHPRK
jgi:hypothetical protein